MSEINNKIENNSNHASSTTYEPLIDNNIFYNCKEYSSLIEILSINENKNIIEFKCLNKDCHDSKKNNDNKRIF